MTSRWNSHVSPSFLNMSTDLLRSKNRASLARTSQRACAHLLEGHPTDGLLGHRADKYHREREPELGFAQAHDPVKGTCPSLPSRVSGFMSEH